MKKISLLDYLIRFLCQYLGKKRRFRMRSTGLARSQFGVWTLWISAGKFRLIVKKNRTWLLLECWIPTRAFTIETGFSRFPRFRAHLYKL